MTKSPAWPALVCAGGLLAALAIPLVTGRVFVFNDLQAFHLPLRHLYQQALADREILLWTPSVLGGFYIHGEGQLGMLHPWHLLLYGLLPLQAAFNLELLANYAFALAGAWWLMRRLAFDPLSCGTAAVLFAFAGFNLLHHHHLNAVAVVAHIPWLLASSDLALTASSSRERLLAFAGVALTTASEFLIGFPQAVWWNILVLIPFVMVRLGATRAWTRLVPLTIAGLVGALIGGAQILPTLDAAARSIRPQLPPDFALTYSLHPINLLQLWSPHVLANIAYSKIEYPWVHEFGVYSGSLAIVVLPWLWIRRRALGHRRALVVTMAGLAIVAVALALGHYGWLGDLLTRLPVLNSFRVPARYIVLAQFAFAILVAVAIEDLVSAPRPIVLTRGQYLLLSVPALGSILTTALWNTGVLPSGGYPVATVSVAATGIAWMIVTTGLLIVAARRTRWLVPVLVMFAALDLGTWGLGYIWTTPPQRIRLFTARVPPPPLSPGERSAYMQDSLFVGRDVLADGNILVLAGYRLASGYVALYPATALPIDAPVTATLAGAKWRFSYGGGRTPMDGVSRARLLADARMSRNIAGDLRQIDLSVTVLVPRSLELSGPPGTARVLIDRPGHLVVETSAAGRQVLSIAERYHRGWLATVDGQALRTLPLYGDFLGAVLEPGNHRVELRFMPASFVRGVWVTVAGLLLFPVGAVAAARGWLAR